MKLSQCHRLRAEIFRGKFQKHREAPQERIELSLVLVIGAASDDRFA